MINALFIFKNEQKQKKASDIVNAFYQLKAEVYFFPTLEVAKEFLEGNKQFFKLIVFDSQGQSSDKIKSFLVQDPKTSFIICDDSLTDLKELQSEFNLECASNKNFENEILQAIKRLVSNGKLPATSIKDSELTIEDFISVKADIVATYCPLVYDVYIKLSSGKFIKLFNKNDAVEKEDFVQHQVQKNIDFFYFKKSEYIEILKVQEDKIKKISNTEPIIVDQIKKAAVNSQAIVSDMIQQMGFTPEAQQIAKSSVNMTLKILSTKPNLVKILNDLKQKEGGYVASHSIGLGVLACAIATKMEWSSPATYFKLSLAAFMHDITLDDRLAKIHDLKKASIENGISEEDFTKIKLHPVHAAEYTRKMHEIPSDVDQIILQHHENARGSGYPRSLSSKTVSPLGAIFIIAHEMIEFMNLRDESIEVFFKENDEQYMMGNFKKIWTVIKNDMKTIN